VTFSFFVYEISLELLNRFAPNSQGRRVWFACSNEFECQGQGHQGQKAAFFVPSVACLRFMFGKTSLWSPYGIGQTIIFLPCGFFFLSSFFPRLISAVGDWMSAVLPHMVWP